MYAPIFINPATHFCHRFIFFTARFCCAGNPLLLCDITEGGSAYLKLIGGVFPIVIGLLCSKAADLEAEAGQFQVMRTGTASRRTAYFSKLFALLLSGTCSIALAVGLFGAFFRNAPAFFYVVAALLVIDGGASIGLGIMETLLAFLTLTGLGGGIWYCIPCIWGARLGSYVISMWVHPGQMIFYLEVRTWFLITVPLTIAALILSLIWFDRCTEGGRSNDTHPGR